MSILTLFKRKAANGKAVALLVVSCLILVLGLIVAGCGSGDFLGLEDYQRDFGAVAIALLADGQGGGNNQQVGEPLPGPAGLSCWDLNGNGVADPEEDVNGDGSFDALDCRGADGAPGRDGDDGTNGADGSNGPGVQALHCWDVNGNGIADPEEDINDDGSFDALDCRGADGADGINGSSGSSGPSGQAGADGQVGAAGLSCWDLNGNGAGDPEEDINDDGVFDALDCRGADGRDGVDGADGQTGVDGQVGAAGLSCWDLNGNGTGDPEEDINDDGVFDALDCRGTEDVGASPRASFDTYVDDFFTVGSGSQDSLPLNGPLRPNPIVEPALGPAKVIAYRMVLPYSYHDDGFDDPSTDQNSVTMRMFFWREGPQEDCFVFRFDAFRSRHGTGVMSYGGERYIKLDDPALPDPLGTMIVIDLPLNNAGVDPASGLCLPADLQAGEFLAFELNIVPESLIDEDVSYILLGVEFFETLPGDSVLQHATVFKLVDDVDCAFFSECLNDHDCEDGEFCNGEETCSGEGVCDPGMFPCGDEQTCDEADDMCVPCDEEVGEGKTIICHVPDGGRVDPHTIIVGDPAVPAHLDHGDTLGPCPGDPSCSTPPS